MADEMLAAQVIDPAVFTKSEPMYVTFAPRLVRATGIRCSGPKNWQTFPDTGGHPLTPADRRVFVDPSQFYMGRRLPQDWSTSCWQSTTIALRNFSSI